MWQNYNHILSLIIYADFAKWFYQHMNLKVSRKHGPLGTNNTVNGDETSIRV